VLSGDHAYDAQEVAERIRNRASELDLSHIGADAKLSLSIGLVCGSPPLVELIDRADRAMYTSKRRGKNTVTAEQGDIA
jgi:diguanylate cyclase (GGDEF)-like protein